MHPFAVLLSVGIALLVGLITYFVLYILNITYHRRVWSVLTGMLAALVLPTFGFYWLSAPAPYPYPTNGNVELEDQSGNIEPEEQVAASSEDGDALYSDATVNASRIFAGPSQYPPEEFAAYGILAFPSLASPQDRYRHLFICEAYIASLPPADDLVNIARSEQMVTVWPTDTESKANDLNRMTRSDICEIAVVHYGFVTALRALKDAKAAGVHPSGIGPFLLAWSPSTEKGKKDALVLVSDLSNVTTYRQAQDILLKWSSDIEENPELWRDGWNLEKLRVEIRLWVDQYGPQILALFGAKE